MNQKGAMLKIVVTGATGRMGRMLISYIDAQPECEIYGATERPDHPDLAKDIGGLLLGRPVEVMLENDLRNCVIAANAVIDFTSPEASLAHAKICAEMNLPYVCGTTGLKAEQLEEFKEFASRTRTVFAPNFSVGVNLLLALAEKTARALGGEYDAEIVETHHRNKVDSPSGTALALARSVAGALDLSEDSFVFGRKGDTGVREYDKIGIHAVRGGDIVGEHELHFFGDGEQITLRHRASSRNAFVRGAVRAALWLQNKEPGLYSMRDVLRLT